MDMRASCAPCPRRPSTKLPLTFGLTLLPVPKAQPAQANTNPDVWQAVKTLLQLHEQLQSARPKEIENLLTAGPGASKHEPFI